MAPYLRVPRILWFALLAASLFYPGLLLFLQSNGHRATTPEFVMVPALYGAALMSTVMSFVMPRIKLAATFKPFASRVESGGGGAAPWPGYRGKVEGERVVRLSGPDLRALVVGGYQTALILGMALSESVAIMGFMLGFLGFPLVMWAPLSAAGTLLIAIRFPTERAVLGPLEKAVGARAVLNDAQG